MKKNNNSVTSPSSYRNDQLGTLQIETDTARLEELIQTGIASAKPMNRFLAEQLHYGLISPQELIDTLRYFSLMTHQQANSPEH